MAKKINKKKFVEKEIIRKNTDENGMLLLCSQCLKNCKSFSDISLVLGFSCAHFEKRRVNSE